MDAVVTDRNGRHISNLQPSDFVVTQDGVTREVRHLSYLSPGSRVTELTGGSTTKLRKEQVQRTVVFLIDDEDMAFERLLRLRSRRL